MLTRLRTDKFESIGSVAPTAAGSTPSTTGGSVTSLSSGPSATQHASTGAGVIPTSINSGAPASNTNGPDSPAETSGTSTQTHSANIGGIVGGVVGGLVGVAMIAGLLVYFRRSRSRRTDGTGKGQMVYNSPENTAFIPPSAPPSPYYASARTDQDATAATKEESPADYVESVSFIAPEPIAMPPMRLYVSNIQLAAVASECLCSCYRILMIPRHSRRRQRRSWCPFLLERPWRRIHTPTWCQTRRTKTVIGWAP